MTSIDWEFPVVQRHFLCPATPFRGLFPIYQAFPRVASGRVPRSSAHVLLLSLHHAALSPALEQHPSLILRCSCNATFGLSLLSPPSVSIHEVFLFDFILCVLFLRFYFDSNYFFRFFLSKLASILVFVDSSTVCVLQSRILVRYRDFCSRFYSHSIRSLPLLHHFYSVGVRVRSYTPPVSSTHFLGFIHLKFLCSVSPCRRM